MKILWLYPHIQHWLGGSKFVYEVCKEFSRNGNFVTLAVENYEEDIKNKFEEIGVKVKSFNTVSSNSLAYWINFKKIVRGHISDLQRGDEKFDLTISSMFPMNYVGNFLGRKHIQIMYEPYALFWDKNYFKGLPPWKYFGGIMIKRMYGKYDLEGTNKSDKLLTLSEHIRRWSGEIYKRDSSVIYEGVDINFFKHIHNPELEKKYAGRKIILHNTSFTSYKGTDNIIAAMPKIVKEAPKTKLLITYAVDNRKKIDAILKIAKEKGFFDNIELLGFLDYNLLPAYYSIASVYVEVGVGRSMSLSNKEAMACETPVITSKYSEEAINGETGFSVNVYNSDEVAEKVVYLLDNKETSRIMGKKGRERVKKLFSWEAVAKKILLNI